jgi:hypothetical protein
MKQVKRVSKKEFETEVEDKITEGYKLDSKTDRQAVLVKHNYGGVIGHFVVFLLTFWWTFFLGNLGYAVYCYLTKSDEVQLKIRK